MRTYQVEAFCSFSTSPAYDSAEQSAAMFGQVFSQVITEFTLWMSSGSPPAWTFTRCVARTRLTS
ncbi:hypothetical protein ASE14_02180 [Agromyces sp. Root81]|nr:hypothetical protein ASE14_02180 [Agromyces sp. Root81]